MSDATGDEQVSGCPVCGYPQAFSFYDLCPCCGNYAGGHLYRSGGPEAYAHLRQIWIETDKAVWWSPVTPKPPGWNAACQIWRARLRIVPKAQRRGNRA